MKELFTFLAFVVLLLVTVGMTERYGAPGFFAMCGVAIVAIVIFGTWQKRKARERLATLARAAQGDKDAVNEIRSERF